MTAKGFLAIALLTGCARKKKVKRGYSPAVCPELWKLSEGQKSCPMGSFSANSVLPYGCRPS